MKCAKDPIEKIDHRKSLCSQTSRRRHPRRAKTAPQVHRDAKPQEAGANPVYTRECIPKIAKPRSRDPFKNFHIGFLKSSRSKRLCHGSGNRGQQRGRNITPSCLEVLLGMYFGRIRANAGPTEEIPAISNSKPKFQAAICFACALDPVQIKFMKQIFFSSTLHPTL